MNITSNVPGSNLQLKLMAIGHRYKIAALYVFGSQAKEIAGRMRGQVVSSRYPDSDVDIGFQPATDHRLSAQDRVRLSIELEDLLGVNRVDLVVLPEADPFWPWISFGESCSIAQTKMRRLRMNCTCCGLPGTWLLWSGNGWL